MQQAVMQAQYACAKCMRTTDTWHSPKIKVHCWAHKGISLYTLLGKHFEVAEKPSPLETNIIIKGPGVLFKPTFNSFQFNPCPHH